MTALTFLISFSGIMETVFQICVDVLNIIAKITGLTYVEVNVIIFCMIWPAFTIFLIYKAYFQNRKQ